VEFKSASELLYVDPPPPPHISRNLHNLNMKSEAESRKTYETWRMPFTGSINLQLLGFRSQTGVMWFIAPFEQKRSGIKRKEMVPLRTISAEINLAGSLRGC